MDEVGDFNGSFNAVTTGNKEGAAENSSTFEEVKLRCVQLLELLQNPSKNNRSAPSLLLQLLCRSPPHALQPFFDYTLFPLLLILDAAVNDRSSRKVDSKESPIISGISESPVGVSDAVAEGVLCCLEELLKKCCLGSADQMVVILKKLTSGALLSPSEASEEFRVAVIRCFKALLLNLHACADESCPCKKNCGSLMLLPREDFDTRPFTVVSNTSEPEECLLAFLQSETASAAVGHWLSLLLKAADVETARGHRGSAALRVEAFSTLRVLVAKVGTPDGLAFFLPGVVSQIGKVLHVSKTMISGAAGSTEALAQAIRGLAEFLVIVLNDDANLSILSTPDVLLKKDKSVVSVLEELRHLPIKGRRQGELIVKNNEAVDRANPVSTLKERGDTHGDNVVRALRVTRTKDWIANTSANVDKLLSATLPRLCIHSSMKVRRGLLEAIKALLLKCTGTLKQSRLMFLECLCVLVCDESEDVSSAAQVFLRFLFSSSQKHLMEHDVAEISTRLIEKLPKMVLGGDEESLAISHVQKLLVLFYFSGPQLVAGHLLQSPVTAARFFDLFSLCLSHTSIYAGSLDKLVVAGPSSGYMHSIDEMNAIVDLKTKGSEISHVRKKNLVLPEDYNQHGFELPRMPPWFVSIGSKKLYEFLAGILRLVAISVFKDSRDGGSLSAILDILLEKMRKLLSEVRTKMYSSESWQSWYRRTGSGQLVRQASTAVCILNEMIFGLSDQAIVTLTRMFEKAEYEPEGHIKNHKTERSVPDVNVWKICQNGDSRSHLIDCVGIILHEYLSAEVWDLPVENTISLANEDRGMPLHFFQDIAILHQLTIDGIGIFSICLGKEFSSSGFLHSSLFKLLETLICSNFQIRSASDAVLHIISIAHGYPTVGDLVLANSDYIVDSVCRQLRHLDLNPQIPDILAALLSYIGVAHNILPLLEEPMHAVSVELEIVGRHQHPNLTIPFLKAVAEIAKASKHEACALPNQAESFYIDVKSKLSAIEKERRKQPGDSQSHTDYCNEMDFMGFETEMDTHATGADMQVELWESVLFKLNDSKRYRRTVGSLVGSCLIAATPLVASADQKACLIALDIIEDGILVLAKVEEAYKHEKEAKEVLERVFELCSFHHLIDTLQAAEDETGENRLLPAMNKIWPFLIACVQQKNPAAVRRCTATISNVVNICGGDFFSRRFHTDGIHFWKLLSTSPFQKKPIPKEERTLQLPYRSSSASSEQPFAEVSNLKVQAAVLNMIADLARNKRSASALEAVLKKVSGIVVGIACSGVTGLHEAATNALIGLATIDPDLVWLLLADVYYSLKKQVKHPPPTPEFPELSEILPPHLSSKGYLYMLYGGQSYGFDIDFSSVEIVFKTLYSQVFTSQNVQLS